MSRTTTRVVKLQTLRARGKSATTVVKLMMACNDLSLANEAFSEWKKDQPNNRKARQSGARMYFVRTQLAHLHEGLKVIDAIRRDPVLLARVGQCDAQTQESFQNLVQFLPGEPKRGNFDKLVGRVRHNLTFHYDESGEVIQRAICDRAARAKAETSSLTRGDSAYLWYFQVADDIVDSIVVRQIWGVPRTADLRLEADKVADDVYHIFLRFVDCSGEFIWKYCAD